jgi:glycerophosphoryl diester phosphodiesterase
MELQGHRGARGLRPENTLPSFETALDVGVTSIETDVHLTRDGVPVLIHDPVVAGGGAAGGSRHRVSGLSLAELRRFRVAANPDPARFPQQSSDLTPVAHSFAAERGFDPYAVPTLGELLAFVEAYGGPDGERAGKTLEQRYRAGRVKLDFDLKRVPFEPYWIGDDFDGHAPGRLEHAVVAAIQHAGAIDTCVVRCFDHRSVRALRQLEPRLTTAILVAGTSPISALGLAHAAGASIYAADYRFLTEELVREAQAGGLRVLPWTVNDPPAWHKLLAWGVDGITTDYPDRLAQWLAENGIEID